MYSSNSTDNYQKYLTSPPRPAAPPPSFSFKQPVDGIPVSSSDYSYSQNQQHQPVRPQSKPKEPWSTGLCDCLDDVPNCCITLWCPCITFGRIAEIIDKGSTSCGTGGALYTLIACVTFCPCCYSCFYRAKMRQQYALLERPCGDCLVHCFCESCALCQEFRELRNRGLDMTIGWHGNMENQHREIAMAPVVEEGMSR